ncbi:type II toxin-antitoxin system CcdA family antitoxin [Phenylobacterium sp.]|uniref:type II toxin-antitoxin system CcdA family antitoxin n=1 Tax=Phenylobacterium sp. TaxID=1871053 RepID=UPI0035B107B6
MGKAGLKIDADLLAQAQAAGVPAELVAEHALREAILATSGAAAADARAAKWAAENAEGIADYNRRLRDRGLVGDEFRKW